MEKTYITSNTSAARTLQHDRFTKEDTALCKGVACILLLIHHLFRQKSYLLRCTPLLDQLTGGTFALQAVNYIACISVVCVSIFTILSGYGLSQSWKREQQAHGTRALSVAGMRFSLSRLLRLMCRYWLIFLLFVPFGPLFGQDPAVLFSSSTPLKMWSKIIINFLGMSNFFFNSTQYTFNGTWWYMSVIIPCYFLFPFFSALAEKKAHLLLLPMLLCVPLMFIPYLKNIAFWIIPFLLGMLCARLDAFDCAVRWMFSRPAWQGIGISAAITVSVALLRGMHFHYFDPLWALAVLALSVAALSRIRVLSAALQWIGKYSANIFLFHTFLCVYYFSDFIYSPRDPVLILLLLLLLCLPISMGIEACLHWGERLIARIRHRKSASRDVSFS